MPFPRFTKTSPKSKRLFDRFQSFFFVSWLVFMIEGAGLIAILLGVRPTATSPFFLVPMGFAVITLVAFLVGSMILGVPLFKSVVADSRRRRAGLPPAE